MQSGTGILTMICSFPQAISMCCSMGSSLGCSVDIFSDTVLQGLQADNLPTVTSTGYTGISAPVLEACPSPPASLTLVSMGLFYFLFHLSLLQVLQCVFYPFSDLFSQKDH